jgi:hypothetical protein
MYASLVFEIPLYIPIMSDFYVLYLGVANKVDVITDILAYVRSAEIACPYSVVGAEVSFAFFYLRVTYIIYFLSLLEQL